MKKILFVLAIVMMFISVSFSQNFTIENVTGKGQYFKGYLTNITKTKEENWTVKNLSVTNNGDSCKVSYQVYYVRESPYEEIPNDTTWLSFNGNFAKFTKKDGSGYSLKCVEYSQIYYTIGVSEHKFISEKFPERNSHYFSIMIHHNIITSDLISRGYSVCITLNPEEFEKASK